MILFLWYSIHFLLWWVVYTGKSQLSLSKLDDNNKEWTYFFNVDVVEGWAEDWKACTLACLVQCRILWESHHQCALTKALRTLTLAFDSKLYEKFGFHPFRLYISSSSRSMLWRFLPLLYLFCIITALITSWVECFLEIFRISSPPPWDQKKNQKNDLVA